MDVRDVGLLTALVAAIASAAVSISKARSERKAKQLASQVAADKSEAEIREREARAKLELSQEDRATAIDEWRKFAREVGARHREETAHQEERHRVEMQKMEDRLTAQDRQIEELRRREADCQIAMAGLKQQVESMREEVGELKKEVIEARGAAGEAKAA